ncbi:hypothetical protein MAR_012351 [Mya arenaria]|uniref:Uncharacterized protein n=1 Tax=Mya arenaria TaxID=6604 RepID=A0ABY7FWT2_MYAAR|nr:hypothetical protein MAR_012351 [Mya arenaria]
MVHNMRKYHIKIWLSIKKQVIERAIYLFNVYASDVQGMKILQNVFNDCMVFVLLFRGNIKCIINVDPARSLEDAVSTVPKLDENGQPIANPIEPVIMT